MKLRKVVFNQYIPAKYLPSQSGKLIEGTGIWETDYPNEGLFHQWANAYEESSEGFGNYTVAIIEMPDGTIKQVIPSNIKFVEPTDFGKREPLTEEQIKLLKAMGFPLYAE